MNEKQDSKQKERCNDRLNGSEQSERNACRILSNGQARGIAFKETVFHLSFRPAFLPRTTRVSTASAVRTKRKDSQRAFHLAVLQDSGSLICILFTQLYHSLLLLTVPSYLFLKLLVIQANDNTCINRMCSLVRPVVTS